MFKLDYKKIDELANMAGGSLRLTSLIISRSRQIVRKSPVLVETDTDDPVQIALDEFLAGKIMLKDEGEQPTNAPAVQENTEKE